MNTNAPTRRGLALTAAAVALALTAPPAPAHAAASDPAAAQIETLDGALLDVMKNAHSLGFQGRYRQLTPVVERTFDIPTMIRFAVGPSWASMTPAQQSALTDAFRRLTVASYAHNFDGYSGEQFALDPKVVTRGPDKVVTTRLTTPGEAPNTIAYRMRQSAGAWKVIDVFYNGSISQLTTRRSDFSASLQQGGAPALISHLNQLVDRQMK